MTMFQSLLGILLIALAGYSMYNTAKLGKRTTKQGDASTPIFIMGALGYGFFINLFLLLLGIALLFHLGIG